jgi:hypothetical protein
MEDLQQSKRGKPRQGFPIDIVRALNGLQALAAEMGQRPGALLPVSKTASRS